MVYHQPLRSRNQIKSFLKDVLCEVPRVFVIDAFHVGRTMIWLPVACARGVHTRLLGTIFAPKHRSNKPTAVPDLYCVSWVLHTSSYKDVRLLTLEYLTTMATLADFNPTLVVDCSNVLISCVKIIDADTVIAQGPERLAIISTTGVLPTFAHLSAVDLILAFS